MKVSWNWLQEYIGDTNLTAEKAAELLGMHAFELEGVEQIDGDTIIEVDILPNRASDSLSHRGVARELATVLDTQLATDPLSEPIDLAEGEKVTLKIDDESLCNRFTAAVITGVTVSESPDWLKKRLEAMGQRPINNIVDATNYVMFGLGQPTHAFDFDKLAKDGDGRANITIRVGKEGESLTLLTGEHIESDPSVLHLVDGNNDTLLDLAGIKGGAAAELTDNTVNICVTSGNFNYQSVRLTSQKLKVFTDASSRNQNEPSPELAGYGLRDTVKLILDIAGGELDGMVEVYPNKPEPTSTKVTVAKTNALLGLSLSENEIESILKRIVSSVEKVEGGFIATSPWERTDLNIEVDYIEEIGRVHGYEHVESVAPTAIELPELNKRHFYSEQVRRILIEEGFSEVITSSFRNKDTVQLKSALATDKSCMRSSLIKNISEALDRNAGFTDLLGTNDTRMFEIGTVFYPADGGVGEHLSLTLGVRIKQSGYSGKEDKQIQAALDTLSEKLGVTVESAMDKGVCEINFTELLAVLPEPTAYEGVEVGDEIAYKPFSTYPHMSRDIAMWVPEGVTAAEVEKVLNEHAGDLRVRTTQFDEFTKDGRTSLGFRLVFQSFEKTLTDEEVNEVMDGVYREVAKLDWEVR